MPRRRSLGRLDGRSCSCLRRYIHGSHLGNNLPVRLRKAKEHYCIVAEEAVSAREAEGMTWREPKSVLYKVSRLESKVVKPGRMQGGVTGILS